MILWQRRARLIGAMQLHLLAHGGLHAAVQDCRPAEAAAARWAADGGGSTPRKICITVLPRDGRHGPAGLGRDGHQRGLSQQAAAHVELRAKLHAAEIAAVDVGDAVVLGQPLIQEGVVGGQQVGHGAIFVHDAVDEQLGLLAHGLAQVVVEIRELRGHRGLRRQSAQAQPLSGEVDHQLIGARVGQHALDLLLQHRRIVQLVLRGQRRAILRRGCWTTGRKTGARPAPDR